MQVSVIFYKYNEIQICYRFPLDLLPQTERFFTKRRDWFQGERDLFRGRKDLFRVRKNCSSIGKICFVVPLQSANRATKIFKNGRFER